MFTREASHAIPAPLTGFEGHRVQGDTVAGHAAYVPRVFGWYQNVRLAMVYGQKTAERSLFRCLVSWWNRSGREPKLLLGSLCLGLRRLPGDVES